MLRQRGSVLGRWFQMLALLMITMSVSAQLVHSPVVPVLPNKLDAARTAGTIVLSNNDLTATQAAGGWSSSMGIPLYAVTSPKKIYIEVVFTFATVGNIIAGAGNASAVYTNYCGFTSNSWGYYGATGIVINNTNTINFFAAYTIGDVIRIAIDGGAGNIWWGKNNIWLSGDPGLGTTPAATGLTGALVLMISGQAAWAATVNFGGSPFAYPKPSGY